MKEELQPMEEQSNAVDLQMIWWLFQRIKQAETGSLLLTRPDSNKDDPVRNLARYDLAFFMWLHNVFTTLFSRKKLPVNYRGYEIVFICY